MQTDLTKSLKSITSKIGSGATPRGGSNVYKTSGISLIRSQNVLDFKFSYDGLAFIDNDQAKQLENVEVLENDILLNITGDSIARACIVPKDVLPARVNQHVSIVRCKDREEADYVLCYLQFLKKHLLSICKVGGTRNALTKDAIEKIEIVKKPNHKLIGQYITQINKKIELNNKINHELEAMAKLLYDYWFVQFDFPNEQGKPYKSSGGKMVYNKDLKREIPDGWLACKLGDVVQKIGTGLNPRDNFILGEGENYYVTIKNIEQGMVILDNKCDKISDNSLRIINKRSDLRSGDILFTSIEPVGTTYLIRKKPVNWNINESVFTIRPKYDKVSSEFLYLFLSGNYIKAYTKNVSAGSIHKGIRHSTLKDCKFILPKKEIVDSFTIQLIPILDKLDIIQKENQKLIELRDWLLPMLMNGQVTIGEAEEKLNMAAEPRGKYNKI